MQPTTARYAWGRWQLPALALAVLSIVVVPFLLLQQLSDSNLQAADAVGHTHEVEAAVGLLAVEVRELEASAMLIALAGELPNARLRINQAREAIPQQLERLTGLTRDNPKQQVLIGRLRELIESRQEIADELLRTDPALAGPVVRPMATRFPLRGVLQELLNNERELLNERHRDAERRRVLTRWLSWGAMLVQLLLLAIITTSLGRQVARRLSAEKESSRASERALVVLQTVREPIVLLSGNGRVLMHNAAFAELYGIAADQKVEQLSDIDAAWRDPVLRQRLSDVFARGRELWDYEQAQQTADGVQRTVLLNARRMPLPDADDNVVLMTISDISVQKAVQRRIADLNAQLQGKVEQVSEVNRELEAFSYSVSHDLRAPLRHVAGFSEKLARHLGDAADDKSRHYLEVIGNSARRMSQLIDDLLVYSRLGRSALRLQAVDMQSVVDETRAMLDSNQNQANEGAARPLPEWRIAPLPILVADENMMRQVWQNLLGNAVKYSSRRDRPVIEIGYEQTEDGGHHFSVRDNGAGFDMAYASKLFGVFQRLHKASDFPGTGIGLATVRRVLGRHGGRIWAESAPEQGATFHFVLPNALDAPSQRDEIQ